LAEFKLISEIIALSVADHWDGAKLEWALEGITFSEEPDTCLCGHFPIIEICTIKNSMNGNRADVGNCCVKKFLGLPSDLIFQGIKRVQKDDTNALNADSIRHAFKNGWITDKEKTFLFDTSRKRNLSGKQMAWRVALNRRILMRIASSGRARRR